MPSTPNPPRKRTRTTTTVTRRVTRPKRRINGQTSNITTPFTMYKSMKGPFPLQTTTTLRYVETVGLAISSGSGYYIYSCNGMYDPNITSTGHQPMGFDQLMGIYNHYKVKRSSIRIKNVSTINQSLVLTAYVDDDAVVTGVFDAPERPGARTVFGNTSVAPMPVLTQAWNGALVFGDTLVDRDHQGGASSNPTEHSYYIIYGYDPNLASATHYIQVEIFYTATFWEQKSMAGS